MTEREKIIEILENEQKSYIVETKEEILFYASKLADTLIENGIGDINSYKCEAEYWEKAYYEKLSECSDITKSLAKNILNLKKDYKIVERALENESRYNEILTGMAKDEQDLNQLVQHRIANAKHQAEKEIEEEEIR